MYRKWSFIIILLLISGCAQESVKTTTKPDKPQVVLADSDKRLYNKALWDIKKKRYKKAEVILNKLISKYPDASGPLPNKGVIYSVRKDLAEAEKLFLQALSKNKNLVQARNYLAVLYRKQGKFKEAKDMLDAAIAADPYYANAYYNLGILYELYLQKPEKALENYQLYLDLKKDGDKQVSQWISLLQRQISAGK